MTAFTEWLYDIGELRPTRLTCPATAAERVTITAGSIREYVRDRRAAVAGMVFGPYVAGRVRSRDEAAEFVATYLAFPIEVDPWRGW